MSDELLELVKSQTDCEQTTSLPTLEDAKLLSLHLTDIIVNNLQDKSKLNTYINFIRNISRQHVRKQCVNTDNVRVYLKLLPFVSTTLEEDDLYLPRANLQEEMNIFYAEHAKKSKRIANIKAATQQSLPSDFNFYIRIKPPEEPFYLYSNEDTSSETNVQNTSQEKRKSEVKFTMAVINLGQTSSFLLENMFFKLSKFHILLQCERDFLQWLLQEGKHPAQSLIEQFPFLLEERLIDIAIKHLQGKLQANDFKGLEWIQSNMVIRKQAMDIIQALFSMANYNFKLHNVLIGIFRSGEK